MSDYSAMCAKCGKVVEWPNACRRCVAASALPPPEPQGERERSGLATGSLPVLDAEGLAKLWEDEATAVLMGTTRTGYNSHTAMTRAYAKAHQLETCAKELRLLMAHLKSRQPEENARC